MTKSQLIRDIAGNNISLENALLRLKIITYSLNNLSLQKWIENELRGYKIDDEIPQYRKGIAYNIRYSGINGNFTVKSVPLSESFFTDEIKKILRERKITNGIGTIEHNLSNKMSYDLIEFAPMVYSASKGGIQCYTLEQVVNKASLENILSNVKIKLIDILLDLETTFGELDQLDIDVKCISSEELQTVNKTFIMMGKEKTMSEFLSYFLNNSTLLGAFISIISSSITLLIQAYIKKHLMEQGETNIYYKTVYNKMTSNPWGFYKENDVLYFDLPLWIEIHNTKGTRQIVRNLNLSLYSAGKFVSKTKQSTHSGRTVLGDNGSYSFLVDAGEIKRYDLEFIIEGKDIDFHDFDEVRLSYFDTNDKYKEYKIFEIKDSWKQSNYKISDDWLKLQ